MLLLALESTCDETAAAVITGDLEALGSAIASQEALHERYRGVVPEIAARAHLERILPTIELALARAGKSLREIDVVAVANTPGLAGSLLVGLTCAKALCVALEVPLVAVNHLQAHIYACRMIAGPNVFPCVGLIVSGGHTSLYRCTAPTDFHFLGGTIDDAAGEAFDKVAAMLSLPFPGGPSVARLAAQGDRTAHRFPRTFLHEPQRLQFSFSGLKTAVRYQIVGPGKTDFSQVQLEERQVADLCASFEEAVVDCLVGKSLHALRATGLPTLCVGGGVAANRRLRERLEQAAREQSFRLVIAPPELCTDNAVMGAIAIERARAGLFEPLDLDIQPGLIRPKG